MKFLDLTAQYHSIKNEIDGAVLKTIENSEFILGKEVKELENEIATYCGVKYGIGLNSGTDALFASLKALGIKGGDEVITTPFTFVATAEVIVLAGAKPVFVDIDPETYNIDSDKIQDKITTKTKAIIPVHLYGQPAEMDRIMSLAKKHNLFVIEDSAQALGAEYHGKKVCSFGNTGCISFFPSKNLGGYGDGGMVVTDDEQVAEYIRFWRIHGAKKKYFSEYIGDSSRLDNLQAAILRAKLPHLDQWAVKRLEKALLYNDMIKHNSLKTPYIMNNIKHVFHQYTLRVKTNRDEFAEKLKEKQIPTMIYYPTPIHLQKAFSKYGNKIGDFPESEKACREVLSLPIYPELPEEDINLISKTIVELAE